MVDFVYNHPDYLFFLFLMIFLVIRTIIHVFNERGGDNDDDDDGGVQYPNDPVLDLPPGVSLPDGSPVTDKQPELAFKF